MVRKYERFENPIGNGFFAVYAAQWAAMTFTLGTTAPNSTHTCTFIQLHGGQGAGTPAGTLTIAIKAVDGSQKPTGANLAAFSTTDYSIFGADAQWITIVWPTSVVLNASTQYAIVISSDGGDASNNIGLDYQSASPPYTGGKGWISTDNGTSWADAGGDLNFREYSAQASTIFVGKAW
jgi:hypothetical protein